MSEPIELPQRQTRVRRTLRIPEGLDILVVAYAKKEGIPINDLYVFLADAALRAALREDMENNPR